MRFTLFAVAAVAAASSFANASLVSVDLHAPGDGLLTLDTTTGFRWLDLDQTTFRTYNEMTAELLPGGEFYGYRRATMHEVDELYTNAGITQRGSFFGQVAEVQGLLDLIGTLYSGFRIGSSAFTADPVGDWFAITSLFLAPNEGYDAYALAIDNGSGSPNFSSDLGHWLILVPSPGAASLFGLGAMVALRRRR